MLRKLYYTFHSGKNIKALYYVNSYLHLYIPAFWLHYRLPRELSKLQTRTDYDEILRRVNYYCKLTKETSFDQQEFLNHSVKLSEQKITGQKVYYFDSMRYARWFPNDLRWILLPGDIDYVPNLPSIVKSRPIAGNNACSVLMKLDKVRHFISPDDHLRFSDKKDGCIFRGHIGQSSGIHGNVKTDRYNFVRKFYGHPLCNVGGTDKDMAYPQWHSEKLTIAEQLRYKFVMSLEGNDVASNLKWVMSSNSIAVMPKPNYETWFMEGTLQPDVHYIEVKRDYSDLIEKLKYYINHQEECERIIDNAHKYVSMFRDKKREDLISLLVLKRYFNITNSWKLQ